MEVFMDNIMIAATQNKGKLKELRQITEKFGLELVSMADAGYADLDVEETGTTFRENSLIKAKTVAELTGKPCIADDTGLCVDYLNGEPGINSARYSGVHGDDQANRTKLLKALEGVPAEKRGAHFTCCITVYYPDGKTLVAEGICPGRISEEEMGDGGFGYDKLFIPEGHEESFASLGVEVKNVIGHRARALAILEEMLGQ